MDLKDANNFCFKEEGEVEKAAVSGLEARAKAAFAKLEDILHVHKIRVASENLRQEELAVIQSRIESLKDELRQLFKRCESRWTQETDAKYDNYIKESDKRTKIKKQARMEIFFVDDQHI